MSEVSLRIALGDAIEELEELEDAGSDVIRRCKATLDANGCEIVCQTRENHHLTRKKQ